MFHPVALKLTGCAKDKLQAIGAMATSDFALSEPNVTNAELQVSIINH